MINSDNKEPNTNRTNNRGRFHYIYTNAISRNANTDNAKQHSI